MMGLPGELRSFLVIGLLSFLPWAAAYGQSRYMIEHYTNENGLPAQSIKGMALDKKNGFLWVGTQAGLVRFDGRHFKDFSLSNGLATASRVGFIARNKEGVIYCEDDRFSVYKIRDNRPVFVMADSFFRNAFSIRGGHFEVDAAKRVASWLRDHPGFAYPPNLVAFDGQADERLDFSFIYFGQVCHYSAAADSLYCFDDPHFEEIIKIEGKVYFVRSNQELWSFSKEAQRLKEVPVQGKPAWHEKAKEKPRFIAQPGDEATLLVYKGDIWKLKRRDNDLYLEPFCQGCSPLNGYITSAQIWEEQGILFLGSTTKGMYVVKTPFLKSIFDERTDYTPVEYAQAEIVPGIINTTTGLAYSSQGKLLPGGTRIRFPYSNIYKDQQGDYWSYQADTLLRYSPANNRLTRIGVPGSAVRRVFVEMDGRLYVVSDAEIAEITGGQYRALYKVPDATNDLGNSFNPDAVVEWKPGVLAIASEQLLFYDIHKGAAPDTVAIPGLTAKVRSLWKYGEYLFIGTYGQGTYLYKNGLVKKMPLDKNRYLLYAHCFVPDSKGYVWISTNRGLFKASLRALTAAYENNLDEIYYHYFGKDDGLFNTELNGGCQPCALPLSSGLYSFPSMNGVVIFDPRRPHTPPPSGQLFIDEILADSRSFQRGDTVLQALPYSLRNLRIRLSLSQFGNPENIYFSYKLVPYNDEWETQNILQNNTLQFGGLKPGRYMLHLRVRNGFEAGQFGTATLVFRILPPWYWSWWFYVLCGLGFLLLIWGLVQWQTARINKRKKELQQQVVQQTEDIAAQSRQLENQLQQLQHQQLQLEEDNQVKSRLIGIISHDLISPLKFMGYMAKKLRDGFAPADNGYQTAEYITTVARELESLSVNMLNWIRFHHSAVAMPNERFDLRLLVAESVEIPAALAREKGIAFYNEVPSHTVIHQYRQAIGVIVYNLAMNAMKHTAAGEIRIGCHCTDGEVSLTVSDTGAGMPPELVERLNMPETMMAGYTGGEAKKYQFGYIIIKDLLRLIQGTIRVESMIDKGTSVTIRVNSE